MEHVDGPNQCLEGDLQTQEINKTTGWLNTRKKCALALAEIKNRARVVLRDSNELNHLLEIRRRNPMVLVVLGCENSMFIYGLINLYAADVVGNFGNIQSLILLRSIS